MNDIHRKSIPYEEKDGKNFIYARSEEDRNSDRKCLSINARKGLVLIRDQNEAR